MNDSFKFEKDFRTDGIILHNLGYIILASGQPLRLYFSPEGFKIGLSKQHLHNGDVLFMEEHPFLPSYNQSVHDDQKDGGKSSTPFLARDFCVINMKIIETQNLYIETNKYNKVERCLNIKNIISVTKEEKETYQNIYYYISFGKGLIWEYPTFTLRELAFEAIIKKMKNL